MPTYKLGCKPPKHDARTLRFARYLAPTLPPPPPTADWGAKLTAIGMMLNDTIGCCTIASLGHGKQVMTVNATGTEITVPDTQILAEYINVTGDEGAPYDPQTGANDNGAVELDVLKRYRNIGIFGSKLDAFTAVSPHSQREVMDAIHLMGGCYIGIALPAAWQGASQWTIPAHMNRRQRWLYQPGSWGGHAVWVHKYDSTGVEVTTWGQKIPLSWDAFFEYVQEAYALYKASDWIGQAGKAPNGFDATALMNDVQAIATA